MRYKDVCPGASKALIWCLRDDTCLFILRSDLVNDPLRWDLPGGHVDPGETHDDAVMRELREELGANLGGMPHTRLSRVVTEEPRFVLVNYAIAVPRRFDPRLNWENVEHAWLPLSEMPRPTTFNIDMLMSNDKAATRLKRFQEMVRRSGSASSI